MDPVAEVGPCSRGVIPTAETEGAHMQSRQRFHAFARRWRLLLVAVVIASTIVGLEVGIAHADAPDPVLSSTAGTLSGGPNGTIVLTLNGGWQWPTHHSDCNFDTRAVGFAVDWNDPNQAGSPVATGKRTTVDGGAAPPTNRPNPSNNPTHPSPGTTIAS